MKSKIEVRPGDWVLLKDDTVIASNKDARIIIELAQAYEPGEVVVSKEPVSQYCYY
jgi:hypothetical protein